MLLAHTLSCWISYLPPFFVFMPLRWACQAPPSQLYKNDVHNISFAKKSSVNVLPAIVYPFYLSNPCLGLQILLLRSQIKTSLILGSLIAKFTGWVLFIKRMQLDGSHVITTCVTDMPVNRDNLFLSKIFNWNIFLYTTHRFKHPELTPSLCRIAELEFRNIFFVFNL